MRKKEQFEWIAVALGIILFALILHKSNNKSSVQSEITPPLIEQLPPAPPENPPTPDISNPIPEYLDYQEMTQQIKQWEKEAEDLVEVNTYGKSTKQTDLFYIKITNEYKKEKKPVVMITAALHGNEPHSTGCVMAYIGTMLAAYGKDSKITELINTREIYFVPIVSPDSYPHNRYVDGVDPNRNFPEPQSNKQSVAPVKAIQDLFITIRPNAVISGHTFGRVFLYPYGDKMQRCPHDSEFQRIMSKMANLCKYGMIRACQMYNSPIFGSEVDWFYRNGAFSCVMEFGTHQNKPTHEEIKEEYERTFQGILWFIQEAPLVKIYFWKRTPQLNSVPNHLHPHQLDLSGARHSSW